MNQTTAVLKHLINCDTITSWEAIERFGATRLSDIVFRLRKKGVAIASELIEVDTRFGTTTRVSRYTLTDKESAVNVLQTMTTDRTE